MLDLVPVNNEIYLTPVGGLPRTATLFLGAAKAPGRVTESRARVLLAGDGSFHLAKMSSPHPCARESDLFNLGDRSQEKLTLEGPTMLFRTSIGVTAFRTMGGVLRPITACRKIRAAVHNLGDPAGNRLRP